MSYRDEMNQVAKETSWTFWRFLPIFIIAVVILSAIGFGLNSLGLFGRTVVERKVFENSFQYTEARKSEIATYEAQLAEIDGKLANPNLNADTRANLEAQKSAINIQLSVARRKLQ